MNNNELNRWINAKNRDRARKKHARQGGVVGTRPNNGGLERKDYKMDKLQEIQERLEKPLFYVARVYRDDAIELLSNLDRANGLLKRIGRWNDGERLNKMDAQDEIADYFASQAGTG